MQVCGCAWRMCFGMVMLMSEGCTWTQGWDRVWDGIVCVYSGNVNRLFFGRYLDSFFVHFGFFAPFFEVFCYLLGGFR